MRKCDICHTIIPPGQDECPNCGYRYRPELKANGIQREIEKKKYMTQFQPHPSPLDNKRKNKSYTFNANKQKKIVLMFVGGFITFVLITVFTNIVKNTIFTYRQEIEDVLDWEEKEPEVQVNIEYGNYTSLEGLSEDAPELVKEIEPYLDYMLNFFKRDELFESYTIEQDRLISTNISADMQKDGYYVSLALYKYFDNPLYQSATVIIGERVLDEKYLNEAADFMQVDTNYLYNLCLTMYNQGMERAKDDLQDYVFEELEDGDFKLTMSLSTKLTLKTMTFNIEKMILD